MDIKRNARKCRARMLEVLSKRSNEGIQTTTYRVIITSRVEFDCNYRLLCTIIVSYV